MKSDDRGAGGRRRRRRRRAGTQSLLEVELAGSAPAASPWIMPAPWPMGEGGEELEYVVTVHRRTPRNAQLN